MIDDNTRVFGQIEGAANAYGIDVEESPRASDQPKTTFDGVKGDFRATSGQRQSGKAKALDVAKALAEFYVQLMTAATTSVNKRQLTDEAQKVLALLNLLLAKKITAAEAVDRLTVIMQSF